MVRATPGGIENVVPNTLNISDASVVYRSQGNIARQIELQLYEVDIVDAQIQKVCHGQPRLIFNLILTYGDGIIDHYFNNY
ncbi:hypothetical protein [Novosphingobium sp. PASSN1]|uniref:hypothetical protein n=1 Tax=Novosphingobium sp. PASSN1 TaxID=2015561 RepID=UPI0025D78A46|nr:hypothetical protein [Novosphingobium sp. PASSN1]